MPCACARIRTSFSCTSICRLVASASCQLPVGIGCGQLPVWLSRPQLCFPLTTGNSSAPIPLATGI